MEEARKVTRCPTAFATPCSGSISDADREALSEHYRNMPRETRVKLLGFSGYYKFVDRVG